VTPEDQASKESSVMQAKNMDKCIRDNVNGILTRIDSSARKAGRGPGGVRLLAATKNRSVEEVLEAVAGGVSLVGENRVQELLEKAPRLKGAVELHFIGHLQRNKVRQVVGLVEMIHSLDTIRLAEEIDARAGSLGLVQKVLVQVNVGLEESKSGVRPTELVEFAGQVSRLEHMRLAGLSTIAPYADDPEDVRWVFRELRELGVKAAEEVSGFDCVELSMGMSNDFEVAVEEGSTIVRVGTALFGGRSA